MANNQTAWTWDLNPLAPEACANARVTAGDGRIELHEQRRGKAKLRLSTREQIPTTRDVYRPGYRPTANDLDTLKRAFPDADHPSNPSWPNVEAELIAGGRTKADLVDYNAPTLLRLLANMRDDDTAPAERSKGGRPPLSEADKRRRRGIAADWKRAKEAGTCQKDFAADEKIPIRELEKVLNWCSKNRQRTESTA